VEKLPFPPLQHSTSNTKQMKTYVLTVLKDGEYQPLSDEEFARFLQVNPQLAQYWQDQESL
jgi:hypothetical protein